MSEQAPDPEPREAEPTAAVFMFEGAPVRELVGKLPAVSMEMEEGYTRGTHIRMMLEVRVRNVRYEEARGGEHMIRQHVFGLESVELVSAFDPLERRDEVGGSASAYPTPSPEESARLGVDFKRSSGVWEPSRFRTGTDDGCDF
jgi:hypothetical protein